MISLNKKNNPIFTQLADKYTAREYAIGKIGEQYLTKLIWHGTDPYSIPFDTLPAEYVIKTNHASGQVIVVKGNVDRSDIVSKLSAWLKINYYWQCREYQYYHIKPRIMIEERIKNQDGSGLLDYSYWCFNGVPEVIQVRNRGLKISTFYDTNWNKLDLYYKESALRPDLAKPNNLEQMLMLASQLSDGLDFVRIDLYNVDGKIYFGEFTFTPAEGSMKIQPESWDLKLGEKWVMPSEA
jgi:hypothetical protein